MPQKAATIDGIKAEFVVNRQGKQFVLYAGLLDRAHEVGIQRLVTTLVQAPTAENGNLTIVSALVEMKTGQIFTGIGDASPENVGRMIAMHTVRMAETRAKARALRDAINVGGFAALEELGLEVDLPDSTSLGGTDDEDLQSVPAQPVNTPAATRTTRTRRPAPVAAVEETSETPAAPTPIRQAPEATAAPSEEVPDTAAGSRPITPLHRFLYSECRAIYPDLEGGLATTAEEIEEATDSALVLMASTSKKNPKAPEKEIIDGLKQAKKSYASKGVEILDYSEVEDGQAAVRIIQLLRRAIDAYKAAREQEASTPL